MTTHFALLFLLAFIATLTLSSPIPPKINVAVSPSLGQHTIHTTLDTSSFLNNNHQSNHQQDVISESKKAELVDIDVVVEVKADGAAEKRESEERGEFQIV